jgi:hypothetical protein
MVRDQTAPISRASSRSSLAAIHLPLDQLELGDLAFGLAVRPGFGDGGPYGRDFFGGAPTRRRRLSTAAGIAPPMLRRGVLPRHAPPLRCATGSMD